MPDIDRGHEVTDVGRVEGAAEDPDAAPMPRVEGHGAGHDFQSMEGIGRSGFLLANPPRM